MGYRIVSTTMNTNRNLISQKFETTLESLCQSRSGPQCRLLGFKFQVSRETDRCTDRRWWVEKKWMWGTGIWPGPGPNESEKEMDTQLLPYCCQTHSMRWYSVWCSKIERNQSRNYQNCRRSKNVKNKFANTDQAFS